jgi:putative aminopeptidase FrvX
VQYGVTGGGNDGAVFSRYGSVDIPLGLPLRYPHFPAEVIDTRDLDALAKILGSHFSFWDGSPSFAPHHSRRQRRPR